MTETKPSIWQGVLIAPLGVPLSIAFAAACETVSNLGFSELADLPATVLLVFLLGVPIRYGAMLLIGQPYVIWLGSRVWLTWAFVCIWAAVLGSAIWAGYGQLRLHPPALTRTIPAGALIGLSVGALFSWVAKLPSRVG